MLGIGGRAEGLVQNDERTLGLAGEVTVDGRLE